MSERTGNNASSSGDVLDVLEASPVEDSAVPLAPLPAGGEEYEPLAGDPQDPAPEGQLSEGKGSVYGASAYTSTQESLLRGMSAGEC